MAQESLKLSKVFIGIEGGLGFFGNAINSKSISSTSNDFMVRSSSLEGNSAGIVSNARFIVGYRFNDALSIDLSVGIGTYGTSVNTVFSSSETYTNIGTYSANDRLVASFTNISYETSFKHKIFQLKTRKKLRFVNAKFGIGMITNKDDGGIVYEEHYWPYIGVIFENTQNDSPVGYRKTKLLEISDFPFTKLGIDYESRGRTGFTFAFDVYWYQPNLFSENAVTVKENENTNLATKIYLNDHLIAYSISISFFVNRLFVKKE